MSTLAEEDPARAIRNAMERLRRAAYDTPFEQHVREESAIVEAALRVISPEPGEAVRTCPDCGRSRAGEPGPCPWCDIFGGG